METNSKYNGWTNYATWRVNLEVFDGMNYLEVFGNNESDFNPEMVDECELADSMQSLAEELIFSPFGDDHCPEGLAMSYARAFLSEVNWRELALNAIDCMIDDYKHQQRYEATSGR
jgi:hypothetical protein